MTHPRPYETHPRQVRFPDRFRGFVADNVGSFNCFRNFLFHDILDKRDADSARGPQTSREARTSPQGSVREGDEGAMYPALRANPFPEVTDLFCRLPLSTLFYQLEAVHLGDLLRL